MLLGWGRVRGAGQRGRGTVLEPSPPRRDRDARALNQAMIPGKVSSSAWHCLEIQMQAPPKELTSGAPGRVA